MPRKSNNLDTALVQVYERDYAKGVRYVNRCIDTHSSY